MIKVVKLPLIYAEEKNDSNMDYKKVYEVLWDLQRQTRKIKNKVIQLCWEYSGFASEYKNKNGEYPNEKEVIGMSLRGYTYNTISGSGEYGLYSANLSATTNKAYKEFNNSKVEVFKGTRSIINYGSNQPLEISKHSIKIDSEDEEYKNFYIQIKMFSRKGKDDYGLSALHLWFKAIVKDRSTRCILERCISGQYAVGGSLMKYNKKKKLWCLNLVYEMPVSEKDRKGKKIYLEKDKILGVFLDSIKPICASVYGDSRKFIIDGDEIESFRKSTEQRRISLLRQAKYCGNGRIGHGIKTRNHPAYKIEDRIARFRDTANHKYSRALVEYAVRNNCSVIQMENLTGVSTEDKFLKNWSYYDLQTKIEQKAQEYGITVRYLKPAYLTKRCCFCGFIDKEQKPAEKFICPQCGKEISTFYNASQNLAVDKIDEVIKKALEENKT
ncbi:MAG: transposase [Clostridia bacterium]|nr:transposase [Clostridia bacterium]